MATPGKNSVSPVTELNPILAPKPVLWQPATITRIDHSTPRVSSFFFRPTQPFAFRAGQHVDVRLTAPDGYRAQRSYSIASAPETHGEIELAIERLDEGEVSPFFHEVAQVGDVIDIRGPLGGHFIWTIAGPGTRARSGCGDRRARSARRWA